MTILGNIAERLRTDIGENLRASIDVDYSRQLTEDRFNTKQQSVKDKKDSDIRIQDRQNSLADEARKQKTAAQTAAVTMVIDDSFKKGEFDGLAGMLQSRNLEDAPRAMITTFLNSQPDQSEEGIIRAAQLNQSYERLDNEQTRILMTQSRDANSDLRAMQNISLKKNKQVYTEGIDVARKNQDVIDTNALMSSIDNFKGIFTDEELNAGKDAILNSRPKQGLALYKEMLDRANIKMREQQRVLDSKANARKDRAAALTANELNENRVFIEPLINKLIEDNELAAQTLSSAGFIQGTDKKQAEAEKEKLNVTVARIVKTAALEDRTAREAFVEEVFNFAVEHGIKESSNLVGAQKGVINPIAIIRAWNESHGTNVPTEEPEPDEITDDTPLTTSEIDEAKDLMAGKNPGDVITFKGKEYIVR